MYVCNCPDSLISTTICKHIHLVCRCSTCQDENYAGQWSEDGTYSNNDREMDRERQKQSLRTKLLTIVSNIEGCKNVDALQQLERSIDSAHSLFILKHGKKHLPTPKENAPHKNIVPQKHFFSTKKKSRKINMRFVKPSKEEKLEITGNWRGDDQISTEKQISSDNINMEGEHVKTIELGCLSCLYVSYASYMLLSFGIFSQNFFLTRVIT